MTMRHILAAALAALITAGAAMAEFTDTDGDGVMSAEEFVAAFPDGTQDQFAAADTDADGTLSEAEYAAAVEAGVLPAD